MNQDNKKEKVGQNKFVAYSYRLQDAENGKLLFEAKAEAPDTMVYGVSNEVVPGLIAAVKDLSQGDKFSVTLPPEAAFGERFEENVMNLDKEIFVRDGKLAEEVVVNAELPMMTQEGYRILGRILEITDKSVKMDFNHPFAGKTVKFDGEIIEVRDATPEELNPVSSCGCGGCGGSCGDGGCGDGCDCGGGCGN
jgi:FKBP-type peptidyl-prolyl cis-trans isomerase SlyD